jgi:hypothetical protein
MKEKIKRSVFIKELFLFLLAITGLSFISCGEKKEEKPEYDDPCSDISELSDADKATRKTFDYTGNSPDPAKVCINCTHFRPATDGTACGTCELVKGPINPNGYCTQWFAAPKK